MVCTKFFDEVIQVFIMSACKNDTNLTGKGSFLTMRSFNFGRRITFTGFRVVVAAVATGMRLVAEHVL
jgi:hypothetical protein